MNSLVNSDKNPNKHSPANRLIALCRQTIKLRHVPKVQERRKQPSRAFKRVRFCTHTCSWWLSIIDVMNRLLFSFSKIGVWDVNFEVCVCDVCSIAASRFASIQFHHKNIPERWNPVNRWKKRLKERFENKLLLARASLPIYPMAN